MSRIQTNVGNATIINTSIPTVPKPLAERIKLNATRPAAIVSSTRAVDRRNKNPNARPIVSLLLLSILQQTTSHPIRSALHISKSLHPGLALWQCGRARLSVTSPKIISEAACRRHRVIGRTVPFQNPKSEIPNLKSEIRNLPGLPFRSAVGLCPTVDDQITPRSPL